MKSKTRCSAKTDVQGDYGTKALAQEGITKRDPNCRYLKDVLRCTLLLDDHAALGRAHAALVSEYTPVTTKDRRKQLARDVLQTVWYEGIIVEVQFHFKSVVGLKAFSHVAYNIVRAPNADLLSMDGNLFDFQKIHLERYTTKDDLVKSRLHF